MKTVINSKRFFRDAEHAVVSGVCAGIAKYFNVNPWLVRGLTIGAFLAFNVAIALAYVMAVLLVRYK